MKSKRNLNEQDVEEPNHNLPLGYEMSVKTARHQLLLDGNVRVRGGDDSSPVTSPDEAKFEKDIRPKLEKGIRLAEDEQYLLRNTDCSMFAHKFFGWSGEKGNPLGNYEVSNNGVTEAWASFNPDKLICQLFTVLGKGHCPNAGEATLAISYLGNKNRERKLIVPIKLLYDRAAALAMYVTSQDFYIGPASGSAEKFQILLKHLLANAPDLEIVGDLGWIGEDQKWSFVLPTEVIGQLAEPSDGTQRLMIDSTSFSSTNVGPRGSLKMWQQNVAAYAVGNSRLTLALCSAFASPLLRFSPDVETGVVHLFGETSTGKTTALRVAGSVWGGNPQSKLGYAHSWNGTDKAILAKASSYSQTLFCLDEFKLATPNIVQAVYDLSSGEERGRLTQAGKLRTTKKFRVMVLSTGELTFGEKLRSSKRRDQQEVYGGTGVRFLDVPACPKKGHGVFDTLKFEGGKKFTSGAELSEHLKERANRHYGQAGPAIIEHLIDRLEEEGEDNFSDWLLDDVKEFVEYLNLPKGVAEEVRRLAKTFGLIASAGKLAVSAKLLPHSAENIDELIADCFDDYMALRGGFGKKTKTSAVVALRDFLQRQQNRFEELRRGETGHLAHIPNRAGYFQKRTQNRRDTEEWFFILPSVWKEEIESVAPRAELTESLERLGLLERTETARQNQTFQSQVKVDGRPMRVYKISARVLSLTDDGDLPDVDDELSDDVSADLPNPTFDAAARRTFAGRSASTVH